MVYNVDTIDDLVNGSTGTIIGFESDISNIECIIVKFDDPTVMEDIFSKIPNVTCNYSVEIVPPISSVSVQICYFLKHIPI